MGAVRDVIIIPIIILLFGFGFFAVHKVSNQMYDTLKGIEAFNQSSEAVEAVEGSQAVTGRMDYVVFGVFIALVLAFLVTGWFLAGNPIFSIIYFLVIVIGVVVSVIMSNSWETMTLNPVFTGTLAAFPITNNLLLNLPIYTAIIGFLGLIVVFAKPSLAGGNQEIF